jgi:hypothetical protein
MLESTWVMPKTCTPVFIVDAIRRASTTNENNSDDHKNHRSGEFKESSPELFLGISKSSEDVDDNDDGKENLCFVSKLLRYQHRRGER